MRIIGGIYRRREILGPPGERGPKGVGGFDKRGARPILDRVKQALFDRLSVMGLFPEAAADGTIVPQGYVLDLFAGTGSLGLEALSRGAKHCTFVENDLKTVEVLKENLARLGLGDQARVLRLDVLSRRWLECLEKWPLRLVFCDPPYILMMDQRQVERLRGLLSELGEKTGGVEAGGVLVLRVHRRMDPPAIGGWLEPQVHLYGSMKLVFYRHG